VKPAPILTTLTVLLFASTAALAQTAGQNQPQTPNAGAEASSGKSARIMPSPGHAETQVLTVRVGESNSCPVSLRARQSAAALQREVSASRPKGIAQLLHLTIPGAEAKRVMTASVTVHGSSGSPRMMEVAGTGSESDAARTLEVRFRAGGGEVSADLWAPGLTAVRSIDLNSVTYSDGSTWKLAAGSSCSSLVDGMMLIGGN
jgi:hypothetical protein